MRDDYTFAARELERLRSNLQQLRQAGGDHDRLACVGEIAQLLIEHPLMAEATRAAVVAAGGQLPEVWKTCLVHFSAGLREPLRSAVTQMYRWDRQNDGLLGFELNAPAEWRGEATQVRAMLDHLVADSDWTSLTAEDLRTLIEDVWARLCNEVGELCGLHKLPHAAPTDLDCLDKQLRQVLALLRTHYGNALLLRNTAGASDHRGTLCRLEQLHRGLSALRGGRVGEDLDLVRHANTELSQLVLSTDALISRVIARLRLGPVRAHAIRRLKTWLERWGREELLARMRSAKRPEAVLHAAVDRFLFAEGLFPITNATVGRGEFDTFLPEAERLLDEAAETAQPGVLIELKQAVDLDGDDAAGRLKNLVRAALAQATEYAAHVRANPLWSDHSVFCVVAYAGRVRFHFPSAPSIMLIYLGDANPSQRSTALEL